MRPSLNPVSIHRGLTRPKICLLRRVPQHQSRRIRSHGSFPHPQRLNLIHKRALVGLYHRDTYSVYAHQHSTRPESEGGADAWERPYLQPIVESRDTISAVSFLFLLVVTNHSAVFQQVDIEDSYDSSHAGARIRICGVTQVWSNSYFSCIAYRPSRGGIVFLPVSQTLCHTFTYLRRGVLETKILTRS